MSSLNSFNFTGRLGGDPRLNTTGNGTEVCGLSVAVDTYGDRPTLWLDVSVWGNGAKPCADHLSKGSQVAIHGQVEGIHTYDKSDGTMGTSLKVSTRDVSFIGGKADGGGGGQAQQQPGGGGGPSVDEDIPFAPSVI